MLSVWVGGCELDGVRCVNLVSFYHLHKLERHWDKMHEQITPNSYS